MAFNFLMFSSIFGLFALMMVFHKKLGEYPEPLPKVENRKREIWQIVVTYIIYMISLSYVIFGVFRNDLYYPAIPLGSFDLNYHLILVIVMPIIVEIVINKRRPKDMGLRKSWNPVPGIVCILFGVLWGAIPAFMGGTEPLTPFEVIYYLITPAFSEEWFYRGFIQQKLERVTSQTKSWIIGGLLFGALHIPTDFFGPIWYNNGQSIFNSTISLINQILTGCIWGILFIKTRNLLPCIASHYFINFMPGLIALV